jgi:integrase
MVRVLAEAGLRRGEIIGLRWPDVDLQNRRLHVRRTVYQVRKERGERTTKGRRSRKVAITEDLSTQLAEWYIQSVVEQGRDATGYVWPGKDGGPMNAHTPNQALARALERAGLTDGNGRGLATPHRLRHGTASLGLLGGVPLLVVSRQLGHSNPNITAQVYAHLIDDSQLDLAANVFAARAEADTVREAVRGEIQADEMSFEQGKATVPHHD